MPCPAPIYSQKMKKKKFKIMFVIEIVTQFSLKNHLTYAAYTAFFFAVDVDVVGTCHSPIFVSLWQFVCLSVSVLDIVCYYFQPYFFFQLFLRSHWHPIENEQSFFDTFTFDFASRNISFSFPFYNLMVNEALVYKHTNTQI